MDPIKLLLRKYYIIIPLLFFIIYLYTGYCITGASESSSTMDVFFYSDTARVFGDLTDTIRINKLLVTELNHYRSLVHPVFMMIFNPIVQVVNLFFSNYLLSVVLLQSCAGALNVLLLILIMKELSKDHLVTALLSLVYGFSFTQILFASQPETFIFAAVFLLFFWYFVIKKVKSGSPLSNKDIFVLVALGVLCLGITITNFFQFVLGLALLLFLNERKRGFFLLIGISAASFCITVVINNLQIGLWRNSGNFLVYLVDFLMNPNNDEKTYITMAFGLEPAINLVKGVFMHGFIAPAIDFTDQFQLGAYGSSSKIILSAHILLLSFSMFLCHWKEQKKIKLIGLTLFGALAANALLHVFYGNEELILYTSHFIFLIPILYALSLRQASGLYITINKIFLLLFIGAEVYFNLSAFLKISETVLAQFPSSAHYYAQLESYPLFLLKSILFVSFIGLLAVFLIRRAKGGPVKNFLYIASALIFTLLLLVGIKSMGDVAMIRHIKEAPFIIGGSVFENGGLTIYYKDNKLLYEFDKNAGLYENKAGHTLHIEFDDGSVYAREAINFNKETGSRLYGYRKAYEYYLIEIYSDDIVYISFD